MKTTIKKILLTTLSLVAFLGVSACSSDSPNNPPPPTGELTISLDPAPIFLGAGGSAVMKVRIANVTKLVSWRAVIQFDASKVRVSNVRMREISGNLLVKSGASMIESDKVVDADNGTITIGALAQAAGFTGVDGSGVVAEFTVSSPTADPTSMISFTSADLYTYPVANPPQRAQVRTISAEVKRPS